MKRIMRNRSGEHSDYDLKITFSDRNRDWLDLVKDVVAMANSGGGDIYIGRSETSSPGVSPELIRTLDGAKVSDKASSFVNPSKIHVGHEIESLNNGNVIIKLNIKNIGRYPAVIFKDGQWDSRESPVYRKGDILFRHGAKSERTVYADIVGFINKQRDEVRDFLVDQFSQIARLPEGTVTYVIPSGKGLLDPNFMLDFVNAQRSRDRGQVLSGIDLFWCLSNYDKIEITRDRLGLLIRSALRRWPTLYWWLSNKHASSELISNIIIDSLGDSDRDKSDAGWNIIEVASLLMEDDDLQNIWNSLNKSRYAHFREASERWKGRKKAIKYFTDKVKTIEFDDFDLSETGDDTVYRYGSQLATNILDKIDDSLERSITKRLTDIGRLFFYSRKSHLFHKQVQISIN